MPESIQAFNYLNLPESHPQKDDASTNIMTQINVRHNYDILREANDYLTGNYPGHQIHRRRSGADRPGTDGGRIMVETADGVMGKLYMTPPGNRFSFSVLLTESEHPQPQ